MSSVNNRQAAEDHNIKLVLERRLRNQIDILNRKAVQMFVASVARTNNPPNFYKYEDALYTILERHYDLVSRTFIERINQQVLIAEGELKELVPVVELKAEAKAIQAVEMFAAATPIPVVVNRYNKMQASDQVSKIVATTRREATLALSKAQNIAATAAVEKIEIASTSGGIFRTSLNSRTTGIVRLNTNMPAEAAKLTQIQVLSGEEPTLGGAGTNRSKQTKSWANMGDSLVRDGQNSSFNHLRAEQTVAADKPFIVNGESLRFPGDGSLGASKANIINCRCSATYDIKKVARTRKKIKQGGGTVPRIPASARVRASVPTRVPTPAPAREVALNEVATVHGKVSKEFTSAVEKAWDSLPAEIKEVLQKEKITVHFGRRLSKTTTAVRPKNLQGYAGISIRETSSVHVSEYQVWGKRIHLIKDPGRILIHELGHAIDDLLKRRNMLGSNRKSLIDAVAKVKATSKDFELSKLEYFLDDASQGSFKKGAKRLSRDPYLESFAESVASIYKSGGSPRSVAFDRIMIPVKKEVQEMLDELIHVVNRSRVGGPF